MDYQGSLRRQRRHWKRPIITRQCRCGKSVTARFAIFCGDCRAQVRRKKVLYVWTPERDAILRERYDSSKGKALEIAKLFGWPKWVVSKRAQHLGLSTPAVRQEWTAAETDFVMEWAGRRSLKWIANHLKRSETSVALKIKRMEISRAIREGYTVRELELCFGVDHRVIDRWISSGKLTARRRDTNNEHRPYQISEDAVIRFIRETPTAFRLDRVDPLWFMGLVIGGGLLLERAS